MDFSRFLHSKVICDQLFRLGEVLERGDLGVQPRALPAALAIEQLDHPVEETLFQYLSTV